MVCGIGINDYEGNVSENGRNITSYSVWVGMLHRCYNKKHVHYKYYGGKGVTVHPTWLSFRNFKNWFDENYVEGYELDKDISNDGELIYSPSTCKFVSKLENFKHAMKGRDNSYLKRSGKENPKSKPCGYYSKVATTRGNFKRSCKKQGWDFDCFTEVESGWYNKPCGQRVRVYKYFLKEGVKYE